MNIIFQAKSLTVAIHQITNDAKNLMKEIGGAEISSSSYEHVYGSYKKLIFSWTIPIPLCHSIKSSAFNTILIH